MKKIFFTGVDVTFFASNQFHKILMGGDKTHPEDDDYNGGSSYDGW